MVCDIASKDQTFPEFTDLLNFVSDDEDLFIPVEFANYHATLKAARIFGEGAADHAFCEEKYECPLTGEEMTTMYKEQFENED